MFSIRDSNSSIQSYNSDESYDSIDEYEDLVYDDDEIEKDEGNFVVLSKDKILEEQNEQIRRISDMFDVPLSTSKQLLSYMKWKADLLIEKYYDGEAAKIYKDAGIADPSSPNFYQRQISGESFECSICFCEYPASESLQLSCAHPFCITCWKAYLETKIILEGKGRGILCPAKSCKLLVDEDTILSLLDSENSIHVYKKLQDEAYVQDNANMRWCPNRGCDKLIRISLLKDKEVTCSCGHTFCFSCGIEHHAPASCSMVKDWEAKQIAQGSDAEWIAGYTKECPKCNFVIHKDGGCQYITCINCSHRFCWICLGSFDHLDHSCNKFKEDLSGDSKRAELYKYLHFFTRYKTHRESSSLEDKLLDKAQRTMDQLVNENHMYWIDVQYIKEAAISLHKARIMLKWSYVYGYYLPRHINRDLFEFLQANLESQTENLSGLLEQKEPAERKALINATGCVNKMVKKLLEGLAEGDITGGDKSEKMYSGKEFEKYDGWVYTQSKTNV